MNALLAQSAGAPPSWQDVAIVGPVIVAILVILWHHFRH